MPRCTADSVLEDALVVEAVRRGIVAIDGLRITYALHQQQSEVWTDPEEWVRARTIAWLIVAQDYPANRIKIEVPVPRRTPNDKADIVVYGEDACRTPYLVIENKADGQTGAQRAQGIEQLFGNANSLRAPLGLYDEHSVSWLYNVGDFPPTERAANRLGTRSATPKQYGQTPRFSFVAGSENDIAPVAPSLLEAKIRRAHSIIWAGGKRDPLTAFDEWSKMLFSKVVDERSTPTADPRQFQVGANETTAAVANRIHALFRQACRLDPSIFPSETRIVLPDTKVTQVVETLQDVCFTRTDIDSIGRAFEQFFGSIFRGGLGQYFTMRSLTRFTVAMLGMSHEDYVIDPAAGSGGFLLEALLQTWHGIDERFAGQAPDQIERVKTDFALQHVYGIEIHDTLARICKINLLLHHDGHTNIEGGKSCLDVEFSKARLMPPKERFSCVVGNPPFGDEVVEGDEDKLGANHLSTFAIAGGRSKVASEHVILERCIELLEEGGRLGLVVPDGLLNNQGEQSNCPQVRRLLARNGRVEGIVSLPDYAFRKSGAQNKTSILFFRKFTAVERRKLEEALARATASGAGETGAIAEAIRRARLDYRVFLAEANRVGYTPSGQPSDENDLYRGTTLGRVAKQQDGTILGEWRKFVGARERYEGRVKPDCMAVAFTELWLAHPSGRLDPKYHLFQREAMSSTPRGWLRVPIEQVMERHAEAVAPETRPDERFVVMTLGQSGEVRAREAGKGNNPPEWLGSYFADMPATWFAARAGDVVYSSIDLWKGCIAVVPREFDGALVTKEFPILKVIDPRLSAEFLQCLLRSRYYQRAFRAITTGHSNRRRTQPGDFDALEISFPAGKDEQHRLVAEILGAREAQRESADRLKDAMAKLSDVIDGRGDEELPDVESESGGGEE
jgi:type I restriction enzyme M protein